MNATAGIISDLVHQIRNRLSQPSVYFRLAAISGTALHRAPEGEAIRETEARKKSALEQTNALGIDQRILHRQLQLDIDLIAACVHGLPE